MNTTPDPFRLLLEPTRDDLGAYVYANGHRQPVEDTGCAFTARDYHGGQGCPLYALGCGDFTAHTVMAAAHALDQVYHDMDPEHASDELFSALEELSAWAKALEGEAS